MICNSLLCRLQQSRIFSEAGIEEAERHGMYRRWCYSSAVILSNDLIELVSKIQAI